MAVDMFLKLDKIKGESKDKSHKDEIDILSWSWAVRQTGSTHIGMGSGTGKANFGDITITKFVDKASVTLMEHVATGDHINKAKLVVRKAGGKALEYIVIELDDIIVTNYSTGGSGGEELLTETITLNFAQIKITYKPQNADGSGGAAVDFGYNIQQNTKK
jgi:type VI secretion system secreted protein Hcp